MLYASKNLLVSPVSLALASKKVENTTPSAAAPAISITSGVSHVSPPSIGRVSPNSFACFMIRADSVKLPGANIASAPDSFIPVN